MTRKNYATSRKLREAANRHYNAVVQAFIDKREQKKATRRYWSIYDCKLTDQQAYEGDSQVFVPIVHDAIEARVKRRTAMAFPAVGQMISATCNAGDDTPNETISLLQHYVRQANLKRIVAETMRRGDVEGQYIWLLDWERSERNITKLTTRQDEEDPSAEISDVEEDIIVTQGPVVTIIPIDDMAVLPATAMMIEDAHTVALIERYSKGDWGDFCDHMGFVKSEVAQVGVSKDNEDPNKKRAEEAGVKMDGSMYMIYRVYRDFDLGDGKEPCEIYYGGPGICLGIYKNPFWTGKVPVLSEPVEPHPGSHWGKSKIAPVEQLQYQANDVINMGMDTARFSILPITMTDPVKNPNIGSMVLAVGAIWETNPNDTQFAEFPPLWKDAFMQVSIIKAQIMESMDVNDVMLGKAPPGRKNAQAVAAQQMEAMAAITDSVKIFERMLSAALQWFYEMDQQYRKDEILIETLGEIGQQAKLQRVKPSQVTTRYVFHWTGSDQAFGMQRVQQMLGYLNIMRGIPPQQLGGRSLDLGPMLDYMTSFILGPQLAPLTLKDERHMMTVPPDIENEMLHNGLVIDVHPADNDIEHIQAHQQAAQQTGDPAADFRLHILQHAHQIQEKQRAAMPAPGPGQPGIPGPKGQPGVPGTPRAGAVPAVPRPVQAPPGAVHADQMADPMAGMRG